MGLIARCTLPPEKFVYVRRGTHKDGKPRYGKVRGGEEYAFQGTRLQLAQCSNLEYVEGDEDVAQPAAAAPAVAASSPPPVKKKRGRPPKAKALVPEHASSTDNTP